MLSAMDPIDVRAVRKRVTYMGPARVRSGLVDHLRFCRLLGVPVILQSSEAGAQ